MKLLIYSIVSALALNSCQQKIDKEPEPAPTEITQDTTVLIEPDGAKNSLAYLGAYKGRMNCDNCPSGDVVLELSEEFNYIMTVTDRRGKAREHKGTFSWRKSGDGIVLDNLQGLPNTFKVADGKLTLINNEQAQPDAVLSKMPEAEAAKTDAPKSKQTDITSIGWRLAENQVAGVKPVRGKEKFLRFKNDGSFGASAGCNSIGGKFKISGSKITFSDVISTRMACDDMTDEQRLVAAFDDADNYVANKKVLQLRKGDKILATFDAE